MRAIKNKWDQLKKDCKLWKELKHGATGLGWDSTRRTIDVSDDWWKERLEVVLAAKKFCYAGISPELEEKLYMMFNEVVASGVNAWAPNSRVDSSSPENIISENEDDLVEELTTPISMSDDHICERGGSSHGTKRRFARGRKELRKIVTDDLPWIIWLSRLLKSRNDITTPYSKARSFIYYS